MEGQFNKQKILVIGDCMLDEYNWGEVKRISPESCVPILKMNSTTFSCGGAANVAYQLQYIGSNVILVGIIGNDKTGKKLSLLLDKRLEFRSFIHNIKTTRKIRFVNSLQQQMFRVDEEMHESLTSNELMDLKNLILEESRFLKCIVLSDYNKGVLNIETTQEIINYAHSLSIPVIVDIKEASVEKYYGADLVKGNFSELCSFFPKEIITNSNIEQYATKLKYYLKARYLVITLGKNGMIGADEEDKIYHVRSKPVPVYDVTGAGDVVTAFLATNITNLDNFQNILQITNDAANKKVGKFGNLPVSLNEVYSSSKKRSINELLPLLKGKIVVFTNGCFDILHAGHVDLLRKAKELGDILIVGLNSDESISRIKGNNRPINSLEERIEVISALQYVDYVVVFEEDTPKNLIEMIKPNFLVKGGDYLIEDIVGADFVRKNNGEVITIPFSHYTSTTKILDKL